LIELTCNVPHDRKYVILEVIFPANFLAGIDKTKSKTTRSNQSCITNTKILNYKKIRQLKKSGLVAFYKLRLENGMFLFSKRKIRKEK